MRRSWAVSYRVATAVGAGVLAALAFAQHDQWWDIVGAVLVGSLVVDVLLLVVVAIFHRRRRGP